MDRTEAIRKTMQGNTRSDTSIEIMFRKALWRKNIRFRKNVKSILGSPDVAIKKYRLVIFCDGDFWHGKSYHGVKSHERFWNEKIKRNQERDLEYTIRLRDEGWTVLRFWESEIRDDLDGCVATVIETIRKQR
ncbi:very short patch repair endonuclease [Succiniclasticum ruminis]|uniref:very short patch repair endonuclease n=1 Tax=Succiniclasticum ruminis TaxID=40841 RepID=UPI002481C64C|nr:very short patch repair endonuclease [Succiniclasticum ruminis]